MRIQMSWEGQTSNRKYGSVIRETAYHNDLHITYIVETMFSYVKNVHTTWKKKEKSGEVIVTSKAKV